MAFKFDESHLRLIRDQPHILGWMIGKNKLTPLHSEWIKYIWYTTKDRSLMAHRGSYKTTAIGTVGCLLWLLFNPNDRIAIIRKSFTDATEIARGVRNALAVPEVQQLFRFAHGIYPKAIENKQNKIVFNFKKTITPEGSIDCYGVESGMTGKHYDRVLCDDIITLKDRQSPAEREHVKQMVYEVKNNIIDPGKPVCFIGTPWHKDDAWSILPKPLVYDVYQTKLADFTEEHIQKLRDENPPSLFAINYLLTHIADGNKLFADPKYENPPNNWQPIAHVDKAYMGEDFTALTLLWQEPGSGKIYVKGKCWREHIENLYSTIAQICLFHGCNKIYTEDNDDKGLSGRRFYDCGLQPFKYHERMNKEHKISSVLKQAWPNIYFSDDTDPVYVGQIEDWDPSAKNLHDDSCDGLASILRELKIVTPRYNLGKLKWRA